MKEVVMIAAAALILGVLVFVRWRYLGDRFPNAVLIARAFDDAWTVKGGDDDDGASVDDR
jgi:hypothetical protein